MHQRREIDMLHGPLAGKLLRFALPLAATGILQQLFNAADVAVVGRFCGNAAMAAVGSNASIVGLLVNLFVGVALGTNVVIAQYTGQGKPDKVSRTVHSSLLLALVCGVFLALLGEFFAPRLLRLMSVPDEVLPLSVLYLRIYMAGMPVILLYNFLSAIFRSQGDTRTPLICLTIAGVVNVALNIFFVVVLGRSVDGVATATVVSNTLSCIMLFVTLRRSDGAVKVEWSKFRPDWRIIGQVFRIGIPAGVQGMVFSLANIVVQSAINSLGATVMAASSAAFNVEILAYFIINAVGQACTTFTGQNYGAGQIDRCRSVLRACMVMGMVGTVLICSLLLGFANPILALFNADPEVVAVGRVRLFMILLGEPLSVLMENFSGALRGFGKSTPPAVLTLAGVVGVRLTWIFLWFPRHRTFGNIIACFPISWAVTAAAISAYYFWFRSRQNRTLQTA